MSSRYGLGQEEAESYVLCDTIGSTGENRWRTEGFRVVGDNERPLVLQSLWKPREGLARRFEIQRRSSIEEKTSRDKDTVTAGTAPPDRQGAVVILQRKTASDVQGVGMSWNNTLVPLNEVL